MPARSAETGIVAGYLREWELFVQLVEERRLVAAHQHRAQPAIGGADERDALRDGRDRPADEFAQSSGAVSARRHAQTSVCGLVGRTRRTIAGVVQRGRDVLTVCELRSQVLCAAGGDPRPWRDAERIAEDLAQPALRDGQLGRECSIRGRVVAGGQCGPEPFDRLPDDVFGLACLGRRSMGGFEAEQSIRPAAQAGSSADRQTLVRSGHDPNSIAARRSGGTSGRAQNPGTGDEEEERAARALARDGGPFGVGRLPTDGGETLRVIHWPRIVPRRGGGFRHSVLARVSLDSRAVRSYLPSPAWICTGAGRHPVSRRPPGFARSEYDPRPPSIPLHGTHIGSSDAPALLHGQTIRGSRADSWHRAQGFGGATVRPPIACTSCKPACPLRRSRSGTWTRVASTEGLPRPPHPLPAFRLACQSQISEARVATNR